MFGLNLGSFKRFIFLLNSSQIYQISCKFFYFVVDDFNGPFSSDACYSNIYKPANYVYQSPNTVEFETFSCIVNMN